MNKKEIMEMPAFNMLVEKMDLEAPRLYNVLVTEWGSTVEGIFIEKAVLLNDDGTENRSVDLSKLSNHLKDVNFIFK
jgi:hypothetical protein